MGKKAKKIITIIGLVLLIIVVLTILGLILFKWKRNPLSPETIYGKEYKLIYQDKNNDTYTIYKTKERKVFVDSNIQPICNIAPCNRINIQKELVFSDEHMKIVNDFIDSFFKNKNYKEKNLTKEEVPSEKINILYSIIYNDESYIEKRIYNLKSEEYTITTDLKWKTMQNDGGSHRSIVYIINLKDYVVTKKEEIYHANLGGTPEISTNIYYSKKIDYSLIDLTTELIGETLEKEDNNSENNYHYYVIESNTETKNIYNLDTINKIKKLLDEYDTFSNSSKKLLFTISSNYIKCETPKLYVYDDYTYEYYYTHSTSNKDIIPKKGIYSYNLSLILDNLMQCEVDGPSMYVLKDEKTHYLTNCQPLEDFLKSINIEMHRCTEEPQ